MCVLNFNIISKDFKTVDTSIPKHCWKIIWRLLSFAAAIAIALPFIIFRKVLGWKHVSLAMIVVEKGLSSQVGMVKTCLVFTKHWTYLNKVKDSFSAALNGTRRQWNLVLRF
jgi:hypothetical protein